MRCYNADQHLPTECCDIDGVPAPPGRPLDCHVARRVSSPTYEALAEALNLLWGELTVEQTRELDPETAEVCRAAHEMVCHSDAIPWWHPHHFSDPSPGSVR